MSKIHLRQPEFIALVGHSRKTKKQYKNLKKHEIHDIII